MIGLAAAIVIHGSMQFWDRTCDAAGKCELPRALSERLPVDGTVADPVSPGHIAQYSTAADAAGLHATLQIFWAAPPDGSEPYLAAQMKLTGKKPLTECTQYAKADVAAWFPVGACSGFVANEDGTSRQVGVTFYP